MSRLAQDFPLILLALGLGALACEGDRSELPLIGEWAVGGHHEVTVREDGTLVPSVTAAGSELRACVQAPATADTSQWVATLFFSAETPVEPTEPERRWGRTICFAAPPFPVATGTTLELCGELSDRYSGRSRRLECRPIAVRADSEAYSALRAAAGSVLAQQDSISAGELAKELTALIHQAQTIERPFVALRLRAIAAFYLRRSMDEEHRRAAHRLLTELPEWIERPEASAWAAQMAVERASLALSEGRPRDAWEAARAAERKFLVAADPLTVTAVSKQAEILARVGSLEEARRRLGTALAECERTPCDAAFLPHAQINLAWWVAEDPAADTDDLEEARRTLEKLLSGGTGLGANLERANLYVNRAMLELRLGAGLEQSLAQVRRLVAGQESKRATDLSEWATLLEAGEALANDRPRLALDLAQGVAQTTSSPRIAAWAWSSVGRAQRKLGELAAAAEAFERARSLDRHVSSSRLGQEIPLGSSRRAEDFFRSARVAVERERPSEAWRILQELDATSVGAQDRRRCGELANDDTERRQELLRQLVDLDRPAAAPRREQRESVRQTVLAELQELTRRNSACSEGPGWTARPEPDFRAFATSDEILLLTRDAAGSVAVARRSPFQPAGLGRITRAVSDISDGAIPSDDEWRALVAPLAQALVPAAVETLGPITTFALHGALQMVPLAALPVETTRSLDRGWLGDWTTVTVRPAGGRAPLARSTRPKAIRLFVVDPSGDLPASRELAAVYRDLFPTALVLSRHEATRQRTLDELGRADWLHVGAHGRYDPAFPELSSLTLSDSFVLAADLVAGAGSLELANLSACHSGRWPTTADSGRFGIAGLLSRAGVPWVVASRWELPDALAIEFNRAFYRSLEAGHDVPCAFGTALARVRERFPAAEWSAILLIGQESRNSGGQTTAEVTPWTVEPTAAPLPSGGGT